MNIRRIVVAAMLTVSPLTAALAQGGTGPDLKADSKTEANSVKNGAATDTRTPGATGSTVVPGNHSSVAGDNAATARAKSGGGGGGNK